MMIDGIMLPSETINWFNEEFHEHNVWCKKCKKPS
jgi:hypothetical protein